MDTTNTTKPAFSNEGGEWVQRARGPEGRAWGPEGRARGPEGRAGDQKGRAWGPDGRAGGDKCISYITEPSTVVWGRGVTSC